jgi:hypothetical protein
MSTEQTPRSDKELWHSLATARDVAPAAVSEMEFAAWLEGRLSEDEAARIEFAVAADPELRRAALDLTDILGRPLPDAPARMAVRAQALVGFEAERLGGLGGFLSRLFAVGGRDGGTRYGLQRAAMATAALLLAVGGFSVGGGLGESFAQERYDVSASASQTIISTSDSSNEMSEFFASDGI